MEKEDEFPLKCREWLEGISRGLFASEIETLALQGLQVVSVQKGLARCTFVVPRSLADKDGNWHPGAIATLIDNLAAAAVASSKAQVKASVSFDISYQATVKIEEEVEIEAKVVSDMGQLSSVLVEVRRKSDGKVVATGKQWVTSRYNDLKRASKI